MTVTESPRAIQRIGVLLALTVLLGVGLWVHPYRAQQASRYALTAALADEGTVVLDGYADVIGIDRAVRDGHIYSDKSPGQPFLAVPFYLMYRAVGGQDAHVLQIDENLGLWWQTFWFASVPLAVLAFLMYSESRRFSRGALAGTLALVFGTLLMPFGALLFAHVLAAALAYGAWVVLNKAESASSRRLLGVGALIGAAVITEYTAALAGIVIIAVASVRHRGRALWTLLGGAPFAALLAWYQARAFGSPWIVSYSFSAFDEVTDSARPVTAIFGRLDLGNLFDVFFSSRGFLLASPIVVVALATAVLARSLPRIERYLPLAIFALYLLIPLFWGNPWGGDSPGPRYMVTALPFLVVPTAIAFERFKRPVTLVALVGVVTMTAATITDPMLERSGDFGLNAWGRWIADGVFVPNLFDVALGVPRVMSTAVILVATIAAAIGLLRLNRRDTPISDHGTPDPVISS